MVFSFILQLSEYSKYGNSASAIQVITSKAQAVCTTRLKEEFFSKREIQLYFSLTLFIPIILMVALALLARSVHPHIHAKLVKSPQYHPVLAGFTLAGTYLMVFILCMDCAAVYYYGRQDHEYGEYDEVDGEFNFFILAITLALDATVSLYFLVCMLYLCCSQTHEEELCKTLPESCRQCLIPCLVPYFYAIFGGSTQAGKSSVVVKLHAKMPTTVVEAAPQNAAPHNSGREGAAKDANNSGMNGKAQNATSMWVVTGMMIAPLFALASHAGYILIAWVTEPVKTTATFLVTLGSFIYLFVMFRQCYATYKRADDKDQALFRMAMCTDSRFSDFLTGKKYWITWFWFVITIPIIPVWILLSHVVNLGYLWKKCRKFEETDLDWDKIEEDNPKDNFSIKAFFMACSWGWPIIGSLTFVLSAFYLIPLPTVELAQYIQNIIQLLIVVLASLITYKVFSVDDSDVQKFMRSFKNARATNAEDDVEAAGAKAVRLASLLMQDPTALQGTRQETPQGTRQEVLQGTRQEVLQGTRQEVLQGTMQAGGPAEHQAGGPAEHQAGGPAEHQAGGPAEHRAGGPAEHQAGGPAEHQAGGPAEHQAGGPAEHQAGGPAGDSLTHAPDPTK